ncbi:MAG: hypothetical protein LBI67_12660 [Treponema sp.]|nr:hypothetical protein [Treponema sp.]
MSEASEYFKARIGDEEYDLNSSNGDKGEILWDYRNNATERFGEDLIHHKNSSIVAAEWYRETEEILNGLFIR